MRAVIPADSAGPAGPRVRVVDKPDPVPGAGQVLVAVRGAGLNAADQLQARGLYPAPAGSPADILGMELAGEVVGAGPGVIRFEVGDRVMAVVGGGAQAALAVVHERHLLPVPSEMSWAEAGGFPETFTTAHDALFGQAGLSPGERLCVTGGAGGVGTAAIQLGVTAGAQVVATVRRPELRSAVAGLGAQVIGTDPDEVRAAGPFDVVLELVGGPNLGLDLECLAPLGRIVVIGVGAGAKAEINLLALMSARGRISASTLRPRSLEDKATAARLVERHVLPLVRDGRLSVPVSATFPLEEADAAFRHFAAGGKLGKVVLLAG